MSLTLLKVRPVFPSYCQLHHLCALKSLKSISENYRQLKTYNLKGELTFNVLLGYIEAIDDEYVSHLDIKMMYRSDFCSHLLNQ